MTLTDIEGASPESTDGRILIVADGVLRPLESTTPLLEGKITALRTDGHDLWVLVDGQRLHRLGPSGGTEVSALAGDLGVCVGVHDGTVWVGGREAALWRLEGSDLVPVDSFDRAPTREGWHTPWGGPPDVYSMASGGGDLYVNVHVGGILRTSDGGQTWHATIDLDDDVHQVAVDHQGTVWAATGRRGLARSTDRGESWTYLQNGLHSPYARAVVVTAGGPLVTTTSGPHANDGVIYRLEGDELLRSDEGLPDDLGGGIGARRLSVAGDTVALAPPAGGLYLSTDNGISWTSVSDACEAHAVVLR